MFEIPCKCGKTKKTFKKLIGEFYIDDCCEAAGYDAWGNKTEKVPPEELAASNVEEVEADYIVRVEEDPKFDPKVPVESPKMVEKPKAVSKKKQTKVKPKVNGKENL